MGLHRAHLSQDPEGGAGPLGLPDVEPTNNAAQRALRPAVIHRKLCFSLQSQKLRSAKFGLSQ